MAAISSLKNLLSVIIRTNLNITNYRLVSTLFFPPNSAKFKSSGLSPLAACSFETTPSSRVANVHESQLSGFIRRETTRAVNAVCAAE